MAINRTKPQIVYGQTGALVAVAPKPIISVRNPTTTDLAEMGTTWCNTATSAVYVLASITAGVATWTTSPASGVGTFTSVTISGGVGNVLDVQLGDVEITSGNLNLTSGNVTIGGDLAVTGNVTVTGDFDITDTASISLTSTNNAARAIYLHANGGVTETIELHSDQGTAVNSINLLSDVGGITLRATGLASADAINLEAPAGGLDVDVALQMNLASSQNAADAIVINASAGGIDITNTGTAGEDIDIASTGASVNITSTENVADSIVISSTNGGIDITAAGATAGEDIDITATGSSVNVTSTEDVARAIYLRANAGTSETIQLHSDQGTGVGSVNLLSDVGGITLTATGLASADAINLEATAGGVDIDGALQVNIASAQAAVADSVRIVASAADGGIDIDAGTGGITIDSTGAFSIDGAAASNVTTTGAGIDLTLSSVLGSVLVESTEDAALAIRLHANGGVSETIQLHSDLGTGVGSINLLSDVGGITLTATGLASADAINLEATAGGIDMDSALQTNITSSQAAVANAIRINASAADGGIDIDSGTGGITIDSTGAFSIDGAAASNVTTTGAGIDLTLSSVLGSVLVSSTEDAALAIRLHANGGTSETIQLHSDQGTGVGSVNLLSDVGGITLTATGLASADAINLEATAGGIDVDAALQINIASSQNAADAIRIISSAGGIDIDAVGAAAEDIVITNTGGSVSLVATEAVADAIVLNASNAAGGIDLLTGGGEITISSSGNVTMTPGTATAASPTATVVINTRVGVATFTGFTTAAGANEDFTITNSALGVGDGIFCTVSNTGANDADMTLEGVITQTAGSLVIHTQNNGTAALNGDVIITYWIIN